MLFFNHKKIKKRKTVKKSVHKRPDSQSGEDRRKDKDNWSDIYHQLNPKQREEIYRIIKKMEEEMDEV